MMMVRLLLFAMALFFLYAVTDVDGAHAYTMIGNVSLVISLSY